MKKLILMVSLMISIHLSAQDTTKTKEIPKFQHHINIGYSYNAWNQLFLFFSQLGGFGEYNQGGYFYNLDSIGDYNRVNDWKINFGFVRRKNHFNYLFWRGNSFFIIDSRPISITFNNSKTLYC